MKIGRLFCLPVLQPKIEKSYTYNDDRSQIHQTFNFDSRPSLIALGTGDLIYWAVRFYRNFFGPLLIAAPPVVFGTILSVGWILLGRHIFATSSGVNWHLGQILNGWACQDPNGSNDPGGRITDLLLRFNFLIGSFTLIKRLRRCREIGNAFFCEIFTRRRDYFDILPFSLSDDPHWTLTPTPPSADRRGRADRSINDVTRPCNLGANFFRDQRGGRRNRQ